MIYIVVYISNNTLLFLIKSITKTAKDSDKKLYLTYV